MKRFSLLWLACLFTVLGSAHAQPTGRDAGGSVLQLCLAQAVDYSAVYPTQTFPTGSTEEVAAVVRLATGTSYRNLEGTWRVVDVGKAAPPDQVIAKTTVPMSGKDRAVIHMRSKGGPLPPGRYRLDVTADGKPWRSLEFAVAPVQAPDVRQPSDLLPLKPGTVWRYSFEQQFAPGVKPELPPGMKIDPDGRMRATHTKKAVGQDSLGTHIEARRNDELVEEEWWKLTDTGLVVTKLKSGGEENTFDPPGQIWPWPLKTPRRWHYQPQGQPVQQTFRMWGPVLLKAPGGEAPGFVVLMHQASQPIALSVERHYLPGVGMVREVVVQAHNGVMLTRWDHVLTAKP